MSDLLYRYNPNELYDYMVRVLFKNLLHKEEYYDCLLYTSDAADDLLCVDLGGRRIIKKKT